MLESLKNFFLHSKPIDFEQFPERTQEDLYLATSILMLLMAGADEEIVVEELQTIMATLGQVFELEDESVDELLELAHSECLEADKLDAYLSALCANLNEAERLQILQMVWQVVLADGFIHEFELRFAEYLTEELGLPEKSSEKAKQHAQEWLETFEQERDKVGS